MVRQWVLPIFLALVSMGSVAKDKVQIDPNFMVVLREVNGANKEDFGYKQIPPSSVTLPNGESILMSGAWYDMLGDMHIRFVTDSDLTMTNLSEEEFAALGLTPEQAVDIAVANIKHRYGEPKVAQWQDGIMLVGGDSADVNSSYFLDFALWQGLLKKHPEGLVVGVPMRGGLMFAPLSDKHAVESMQRDIHGLFEAAGQERVSSALYLFRDNTWSVFQQAAPAK